MTDFEDQDWFLVLNKVAQYCQQAGTAAVLNAWTTCKRLNY